MSQQYYARVRSKRMRMRLFIQIIQLLSLLVATLKFQITPMEMTMWMRTMQPLRNAAILSGPSRVANVVLLCFTTSVSYHTSQKAVRRHLGDGPRRAIPLVSEQAMNPRARL